MNRNAIDNARPAAATPPLNHHIDAPPFKYGAKATRIPSLYRNGSTNDAARTTQSVAVALKPMRSQYLLMSAPPARASTNAAIAVTSTDSIGTSADSGCSGGNT